MWLIFINGASILAYSFAIFGVIVQIFKTLKTKTAQGVALSEVLLRLFSMIVILVKFIAVGDLYLLVGQSILCIVTIMYLYALLLMRRHDALLASIHKDVEVVVRPEKEEEAECKKDDVCEKGKCKEREGRGDSCNCKE